MMTAMIQMQAQYKKASFLNKTGRTHEIGFSGRFISASHMTLPGIYYSYGKDNDKRLFHWFDLELMLPSKFKYNTYDVTTNEQLSVTGKTTMALAWRYNLACYLTDNTNDEKKFLPYVNGGINLIVVGGDPVADQVWENDKDEQKLPVELAASYGAHLGVGGIYKLKENLGLKFNAGYNYQANTSSNAYDGSGYSTFYPITSHPYVTIGLRFRMERDN